MKPRLMMVATAATLMLVACSGNGCSGDTSVKDPNKVKIKNKVALTKEQKIANEYLGEMDKLATVLEDVKDEKSAKKAAATIRKIGEDMNAMKEKYGDDIGERKMAMIMVSRGQEFAAVQQRLMMQMMRIGATDPALMQTITKEMDAIDMQ